MWQTIYNDELATIKVNNFGSMISIQRHSKKALTKEGYLIHSVLLTEKEALALSDWLSKQFKESIH